MAALPGALDTKHVDSFTIPDPTDIAALDKQAVQIKVNHIHEEVEAKCSEFKRQAQDSE